MTALFCGMLLSCGGRGRRVRTAAAGRGTTALVLVSLILILVAVRTAYSADVLVGQTQREPSVQPEGLTRIGSVTILTVTLLAVAGQPVQTGILLLIFATLTCAFTTFTCTFTSTASIPSTASTAIVTLTADVGDLVSHAAEFGGLGLDLCQDSGVGLVLDLMDSQAVGNLADNKINDVSEFPAVVDMRRGDLYMGRVWPDVRNEDPTRPQPPTGRDHKQSREPQKIARLRDSRDSRIPRATRTKLSMGPLASVPQVERTHTPQTKFSERKRAVHARWRVMGLLPFYHLSEGSCLKNVASVALRSHGVVRG